MLLIVNPTAASLARCAQACELFNAPRYRPLHAEGRGPMFSSSSSGFLPTYSGDPPCLSIGNNSARHKWMLLTRISVWRVLPSRITLFLWLQQPDCCWRCTCIIGVHLHRNLICDVSDQPTGLTPQGLGHQPGPDGSCMPLLCPALPSRPPYRRTPAPSRWPTTFTCSGSATSRTTRTRTAGSCTSAPASSTRP